MNLFTKKEVKSLISISSTVCLTGHRPKLLPWGYDENKESCLNFKAEVKKVFKEVIECGLSTFLTGMAEGFDMIGAEILFELRKTYKHIKVIAVVPCLGQESRWSMKQQKRYKKILSECDDKIILSDKYTPTCMNIRNKYMVESSSVCIACYNGKPSGTGNTVRFAKQNGNKVIIINPEEFR